MGVWKYGSVEELLTLDRPKGNGKQPTESIPMLNFKKQSLI
jgi:hypothetical protein